MSEDYIDPPRVPSTQLEALEALDVVSKRNDEAFLFLTHGSTVQGLDTTGTFGPSSIVNV